MCPSGGAQAFEVSAGLCPSREARRALKESPQAWPEVVRPVRTIRRLNYSSCSRLDLGRAPEVGEDRQPNVRDSVGQASSRDLVILVKGEAGAVRVPLPPKSIVGRQLRTVPGRDEPRSLRPCPAVPRTRWHFLGAQSSGGRASQSRPFLAKARLAHRPNPPGTTIGLCMITPEPMSPDYERDPKPFRLALSLLRRPRVQRAHGILVRLESSSPQRGSGPDDFRALRRLVAILPRVRRLPGSHTVRRTVLDPGSNPNQGHGPSHGAPVHLNRLRAEARGSSPPPTPPSHDE